ncbi:MAG: polyprenyl synthetase family protein [Myxococcales bacterium]|nr:polyprenyl synthetase family protein [Myxococcales bacterium]
MQKRPFDWPATGPVNLDIHDLPHASSSLEWWYVNTHIYTEDGIELSLFASFFRIIRGRDENTKQPLYARSVTWGVTDAARGRYLAETVVDRSAPEIGLKKLKRSEGKRDDRLIRAMREVLLQDKVPYPDRMFNREPFEATRKLELDYDGLCFKKLDDNTYHLKMFQDHHKVGCDLIFKPQKAPIRHGADGVVAGPDGSEMFYYSISRCEVTGTVILDGLARNVSLGVGWYDHEFGGYRDTDNQEETQDTDKVSWNWVAVQLADGTDISAYTLFDVATGHTTDQRLLVVKPDGEPIRYDHLEFSPTRIWRSTRTFNDYPTGWRLRCDEAQIDLELTGRLDDQEFITVISPPAFWEGSVDVNGSYMGAPVTGRGYVERSGHVSVNSLDDFFGAVGEEVRASVRRLLPFDPTFEEVRDLVAGKGREYYLDGVDIAQLVRTLAKPVREITDRGGKSWRSYAALACCDVVGGDSRRYVHWLAMPELMHVGSLIVDDVQDKSEIRRGGPTTHLVYGEPLAINAGTACYFMGQNLLRSSDVSDADKLRLYHIYFEALRAGHAGQALDIDGVADAVPHAVETGDGSELEKRIIAIHRLKTAAPAGALSRMGAVAGHGTELQIEGIGRFFEALGLAFQIVDDVLNLRGFKKNLKDRGEDLRHGKVTLPVAKAFSRMNGTDRKWLWSIVQEKSRDQQVIEAAIEKIEACGALEHCMKEAGDYVELAWQQLNPLVEDSLPKLMLRAFGWYVLERHY